MVRGAAAAKAVMVVAGRSSFPIEEIAAEAKTPLWYQVDPEPDSGEVRRRIDKAVNAGCKAVCLTIGDWSAIDRLRQNIKVPVLLKGIMSPEEADKAARMGVQGIVVSNYASPAITGIASPIEMLPSIAGAVAGKLPILIDGSFRRGSDILKALALGAQAVLLARPTLWGLSAYGAEGVQKSIELLQTELARDMAGCGRVNLKSIDSTVVRIHSR
jgi:isopentenyl diphosphate isomerase/L-lactate dehydrogenase-like FMN-dependent dehydrogenase